MPKPTGPTNEETRKLIAGLRKEHKQLARHLQRPARSKKPVNLARISKMKGDAFAVPGKVLALGSMDKPAVIYALSFSAAAREKIAAAGGHAYPLKALLKDKAKAVIVR